MDSRSAMSYLGTPVEAHQRTELRTRVRNLVQARIFLFKLSKMILIINMSRLQGWKVGALLLSHGADMSIVIEFS